MKKFSESDLKKAIIAAAAQEAKHMAALRPPRAQQAELRKRRREMEKMTSAFLKKAGFDVRGFRALEEKRGAQMERVVAKQKTDALRHAKQRRGVLRATMLEQSKGLRTLAARGDFFPHPTFTLDKPFLIWSTPLADISDSAAVPFGSWAKFKFSTSQYQGPQKFGFYFYWINDHTDYAVINAATFFSATGHLKSHAPWGFGVNTSWVRATAWLSLWLGWPSGSGPIAADGVFLEHIGAMAQTFNGGHTRGRSVSSGVNLNVNMVAVPPGRLVVFEVALYLEYENDEGDIEADFQSGDFKIACPVVVFSLLNMPPTAMG